MSRFAFIISSMFIMVSCTFKSGSGHIVKETRSTGSFTGLDVSGGFKVELRNGPDEKVVVEADDNLIKYVKTEVSGDQLKISLKHINNLRNAHLRVYITAPEINQIKASASADVSVRENLKSPVKISIRASSGSNIKTMLDAPEVEADASSGGEITLSGRTKNMNAESSSGSAIHANELMSENSYVSTRSGATASVHASVVLDAKASSGGSISYRGGANVKKSVSSGGEVEKEN